MTEQERRNLVEDELFLLRDSGELPEVAHYSSLHYRASINCFRRTAGIREGRLIIQADPKKHSLFKGNRHA